MGIGRKQLFVRSDSPAFVILLELRPGNLIESVIGVVGLRIALDEFGQYIHFIAVFMLESKRVTFLEKRIVGSCRL